MIAALPMYDRPETAAAHDALWAGVRARLAAQGIAAPRGLTRGGDLWALWQDPGLILGQTCVRPLYQRLAGRVRVLGSPDLGLSDTPPGYYRSLFVVRRGDNTDLADYAARRFAYNQRHSHSGWNAAQMSMARLGMSFTDTRATGAHAASARRVAGGRADIAAIDAHTWRAITAYDGDVAQALQVIGRTDAAPAPPYIAASGAPGGALRAALGDSIAHLAAPHAATLGLRGLVTLDPAAYRAPALAA